MESRRGTGPQTGRPRRRKIALACGPCRERKSRCDGSKPICGPCERRSYPISRCVYKSENAQTASNEEYIRALHHRIQELEETCLKANTALPGFSHQAGQAPSVSRSPLEASSLTLLTPANDQSPGQPHEGYPVYNRSNVTAMGAINPDDEGERPMLQSTDYFGGSSTASLMRLLAQDSDRSARPQRGQELGSGLSSWMQRNAEPPATFQVEDFLLPPRNLADHLLDCFWERVYCLYPFFNRPSFQDAYDNLWLSRDQPAKNLSELDIGLGNQNNSGSRSAVFACALNIIFALGCHFTDIGAEKREEVAHMFFLRSKHFIGLDLLEFRTVGVVQTLLVVALYLQSTPYPDRCWNAVGIACRLAQGLGLHEAQLYRSKDPLEQEIQRRTWHGCVIMDMIVSMTHGRPSMTSHLASIPLPLETTHTGSPSLLAFYNSTISLYQILDSILSDVYKAWRGRSNATQSTPSSTTASHGRLDVIMGLEQRLFEYESDIPSFLSWNHDDTPNTDPWRVRAFMRQRNVLHARYLYLHLLLYRPIFTQLCSDGLHARTPTNPTERNSSALPHSTLYSSMLSKCAAACVRAAIDLVSLVHDTYQSSTTDTWWYNGFYTSTAGMVLIMSYTCQPIFTELNKGAIDQTWDKCEQILQHMGPFSLSARNTLRFLQTAHSRILPAVSDPRPERGPRYGTPQVDSHGKRSELPSEAVLSP
ncbi:hypothetical protein BO71DRAFT_472464 [Aspergillus ellipticus CBS 707.79]|uniref:Zn(2)-C6 fungal-type domain-containing protein n=1 Tax=Aspergillus ellipticus CBS 707.79 TaxID=1448320 RepID=A0A319E680_9EURO|nr:hypothetical protein BO71DRAFT_472464 [Aspergillus ellipticus CBS 707.79]